MAPAIAAARFDKHDDAYHDRIGERRQGGTFATVKSRTVAAGRTSLGRDHMKQVSNVTIETGRPYSGAVVLASGHRLFFLAAGVHATTAMALWLAAYRGYVPLAAVWHGHEMVFGFAVAAVAGFLMAAVPKWTNRAALQGWRVAALFALWLIGRIGMVSGATPLLDLMFLPVLALIVATDVVAARNVRNYQVPALLLVLAGLNVAYHYWDAGTALRAAIFLIAALIALIGGRIVPAFTQNALRLRGWPGITCHTPRLLDHLAVPAVLAAVATELVLPQSPVSGWLALACGAVLGLRMLGWQTIRTLAMPIVWILHVGYAWLPIGFALKGVADLTGWIDATSAMHALSAGAIGVMILAVASRAALGHAGRPLIVASPTVIAYGLVIAAAVLRVFVPVDGAILAAGVLWTAGYGIFSVVYWPILTRPRVDGLPG
jgi:uncharacterized protein involved in response to NO